jgi:hypothetical protein
MASSGGSAVPGRFLIPLSSAVFSCTVVHVNLARLGELDRAVNGRGGCRGVKFRRGASETGLVAGSVDDRGLAGIHTLREKRAGGIPRCFKFSQLVVVELEV